MTILEVLVLNKNCSLRFIIFRFNHCSHMDYFNDVFIIILGLETGNCIAVYEGSESFWISSTCFVRVTEAVVSAVLLFLDHTINLFLVVRER